MFLAFLASFSILLKGPAGIPKLAKRSGVLVTIARNRSVPTGPLARNSHSGRGI